MASDTQIAKLLSHISACRTAVLPGSRLAFWSGTQHIGYVQPAFAARLAAASPAITITENTVFLAPEALSQLNSIAHAAGLPFRAEQFDVRATPDGPVLTTLDRGALPSFGVIGVGAHLNGLVRRPEGWHLWIAKRAANKKLDPGKFDNLVAGGVAAGHTPFETIIKESEEEAALPSALAAQARQVARFTYNMERPEGLRRDVIYVYDLELPESFVPSPADGEVESFTLRPLTEVLEMVSTTDAFKFNVNLVLIDLLIRFELIEGDAAATLRAALNG